MLYFSKKKHTVQKTNSTRDKKTSPNEELLWLIREQKYEQVDELLLRAKTTEFTDNDNIFTALQLAVIVGNHLLVKRLLNLGADPETRGFKDKQFTPLQLAAKYGHSHIAQLLVEWGARLDGVSELPWRQSDPPIHIAAYHGQLDVFNTFLSLKADVTSKNFRNGTLLHTVCAGSWNTTDSSSFNSFDNSYSTQSMSCGHKAILLKLIQLGIDVNARDCDGDTPLHVAIERGNSDVIRTLVNHGASAVLTNRMGETFLHRAVLSRFLKIEDLKYMLSVCLCENQMKEGGNGFPFPFLLNHRNKLGYSALHNAVQCNNPEAVECLLENGANSTLTLQKVNNAKSWKIMSALTPVQLACALGNYEALKALNPVSCDELAETKEGMFGIIAFTWCNLIDVYKAEKRSSISLGWYLYDSEEKFIKIAAFLAPKAKDINAYLPGLRLKRTVLHFSVFKKRKNLLVSICKNPIANLEIPDGNDKTALQVCLAKKTIDFLELTEILIQNGASVHVSIVTDNISRTVLMKAIEIGSTKLVRQVLKAGAHNDEEMICTECKQSLFYRQDAIKSSIIRLLLLADYRLSSFNAILIKHSTLSNKMLQTLEMLEMRQSEVFSLKCLTRKVIRNHLLHSKYIDELPVPSLIKAFLYIPELYCQ